RWVWPTMGAIAVVGLLIFGLGALDSDLGWVVGTGSYGLAVGVLQWLVLKPQVPRAGWWVLASTVGWLLGVPAGEAVGWNGLGAVHGIITGAVLVLLLRQNSRPAEGVGPDPS
ncbi:MAG: hypothetical protein GY939_26655, partial [Actinomycetia bacterium]|nr:hypothetical protein [Actinomycetes bacterium]